MLSSSSVCIVSVMISLCDFCWTFSDLDFLCFFLLATVVTVVVVVVSSRMSGVSVEFSGIW